MDGKTFQLTKPLERGEGEVLTELSLRGITTEDYVRLGAIWSFSTADGGQAIENRRVAVQYIIRLGGLTEKEVYRLELCDFKAISSWITQCLSFTPGSVLET